MANGRSKSLTDDDLVALLRKEEAAASNYQGAALCAAREDALDYYDRRPYGDETVGASGIVTSEFADVIESIMPGLMRVFTATDDGAEFTPGAPGEERWAREASDYVPHVLMRENDGFRILYWLIKDALMYRLGGATVDLEDCTERRHAPVQALTQDAIDLIVAEAEKEDAALEMDLAPDPDQPTFSGAITLIRKKKRVVVDNIAPEDILFTPTARDQDKASFLGFRKRVTASDLVEMGMSPTAVDELRSDREISVEDSQRNDSATLNEAERDQLGDSERSLWLVVAYLRVDADGDGISEMLRVVYAHAGGTVGRILEKPEWEGPASIVLASPILMSHTIVGRSLFDQTRDLQEIGSALTRGLLDNLYIVNRPRPVVSDKVNIESLLDWIPGSPVRLAQGASPLDNHVTWLQVPSVTAGALTALEYFQTVRENRTGVARNTQGIESPTPQNGTLGGLSMLMSASQERQELIARVLAETAIKRLYGLVYRAIKRACSGPQHYWSGSVFAACDPSRWPDEMAVSVNVGLGTGNKEQAMLRLGLVGQLQDKLVALQGGAATGPFVTPGNIANATQKVTEVLGFKTPGLFFQPPEKVAAAPPAEPAPPAPSPELLAVQAAAQAESVKLQADLAREQQKMQARIALEREEAVARLAILREEAALRIELKREEARLDAELKIARQQVSS